MPDKIDIRTINRKKLGGKLRYGDHITLQQRLARRGVQVSDKTIRNAFDPRHPLGYKVVDVIKETLALLKDKHNNYQVSAPPELIEELQEEGGV